MDLEVVDVHVAFLCLTTWVLPFKSRLYPLKERQGYVVCNFWYISYMYMKST